LTIHNKYKLDLTKYHKAIVGEGKSDSHFFQAFCEANDIVGFGYAFTGMHDPESLNPAGFDAFVRYLPALCNLSGFNQLTDLVLVCDSAESQEKQERELRKQIQNANREIAADVYPEPNAINVIQTKGMPRVHILMIPKGRRGGLESICIDVARDHQNIGGDKGTRIEGWVNAFADSACSNWTVERRDKLRLQAFMSAAWDSKPDLHFSQLFEITRNKLVPLNGRAFDEIREFLSAVAAL
jgi:hypothetical protein